VAAGVIASLIETCKLCGVEPQTYLTDVITKIINDHPNSKIDDLLPWAYPAAQARGLKTPVTLVPQSYNIENKKCGEVSRRYYPGHGALVWLFP
jgi:hypothetical protein